jgi:hypothetical protein
MRKRREIIERPDRVYVVMLRPQRSIDLSILFLQVTPFPTLIPVLPEGFFLFGGEELGLRC